MTRPRPCQTIRKGAEVTALRVWHCHYVSLAPVAQYPNLTTLVVATYPDADLEPIASLEGLEFLSLLHLPGVTDLAPLAHLTRLRTVRLATLPSWDSSGKVTEVDSLRPLALLPELTQDRDAEIERLERLGARRVDVGQSAAATWTVLADPEGNEFCVLSSREM